MKDKFLEMQEELESLTDEQITYINLKQEGKL